MYASNLARILSYQLSNSDFCAEPGTEFLRRFEQMRSFGVLPQGRENRTSLLSIEQIAAAIIGIATMFPGYAGHGAYILRNLKVWKDDAPFLGATTLQDAIIKLLSEKEARDSFSRLEISGAETFGNSYGYAILSHKMGETAFGWVPRNASTARALILRKVFFDELARDIEITKKFPSEPEGDGHEYGDEEARAAHYRKLGATKSSRFLNLGVDNQVTWPHEPALIQFDKYKFVLMPKTKDHVQSIHVDLHANRLNDREAMTIINRFLSVMTWCCDQYAIAQTGWSGNPVPVAVLKRDLAFATTHRWMMDRKIPATDEQRRALALYREARNAEDNFLVSYAVLNFIKILESRYPDGDDIRKWLDKNFDKLTSETYHKETLGRFLKASQGTKPSEYLWNSCRLAVAHIRKKGEKSDPDDAEELSRLHNAADMLKIFARYFIEHELGVSDCLFDGT